MADSKFNNDDPMNQANSAPQPASGGATDIFGTYIPATSTADDEMAQLLGTAPAPKPAAPGPPPPVVVPEPVQPVVHERTFKSDPTAEHGSQALMDLLKATPPTAPMPAAATPLHSPAPAGGVPNSGFTQLLRALNFDQPKPETPKPTLTAPVNVATAPAAQSPPPPTTPMQSITQLLRTIDEPQEESYKPAPPPAHTPDRAPWSEPLEQATPSPGDPAAWVSEPASFTQLFSTEIPVESSPGIIGADEQTREFSPAISPSPTPPPHEEAAIPSAPPPSLAGSFTQMFAALEVPAPAPAKPACQAVQPLEARAAPAGSFTQMFAALETAAVPAVEPARQATAPLMADTALKSSVEPLTPPEPTVETPAASAGSSTQMFHALGSPEAARGESPRPEPSAQAPSTPGAPAPSLGDSFTQLFSTLDLPQASLEAPHVAIPASAPGSPNAGSFTQMFQALGSDPVLETSKPAESATSVSEAATQPAKAPAPGSFTEMFRSLEDAPASDAVELVSRPVHQAPAASSAGSFTQLFSTLDAAPSPSTARSGPSGSPLPPPTLSPQSPAAAPGSFTQMFTTPAFSEPDPPRAAAPSSPPGAFTQMFSTLQTPQESALGYEPSPTPSVISGGSFTQLFRTLDPVHEESRPSASGRQDPNPFDSPGPYAPEPNRTPTSREAGYSQPPAAPEPMATSLPQAPPSGSGGLTQLLRTLDQPAPTSSAPSTFAPPPAPAAPLGGTFTSAYATLDNVQPMAARTAALAQHPSASTSPLPTPAHSGPSEFTRILNASALREAGIRSSGPGIVTPAVPSAGTPGTPGSQISMPQVAMPQIPQAQTPPLAVPQASGGAPPAAPHFAPPATPQAPAIPQMKAPEIKLEAPAAGGMGKYLPLLLILIIFLLAAVLIAVIFLMKK